MRYSSRSRAVRLAVTHNRPVRRRADTVLLAEKLEDRTLLANTGAIVFGPFPPSNTLSNGNTAPLNMLYNSTDAPATNTGGAYTGIIQVPGNDATGANPNTVQVPYSASRTATTLANVPYIVNGSAAFNAAGYAPQSNDWWSPLMFRVDPTTVGNNQGTAVNYSYSNAYMFQDPGVVRFTNNQFNAATGDWVEGLGIFNPDTFGITPGQQGSQATTVRGFNVTTVSPLTVGIGSGKRVIAGSNNGAIAPLDDPSMSNPNGPDEARLLTRVNDYSDWGVQVVYGDGSPDAPAPINVRTH